MKEIDHLEDLSVDERMILKRSLKGKGWQAVNCINLAQSWAHVVGFCEHGDEPSGSVESGEFLE